MSEALNDKGGVPPGVAATAGAAASSPALAEREAALAVLAKADSTMTQLLQAIATLEKGEGPGAPARRLTIGLSSSATIDLLGTYLRKHGLLAGARVDIVPGNYDDPIGDVERFTAQGVRHMVMLPFFDTLLPAFESQLDGMAPDAIAAKEFEIRSRYRLAFENAKGMDSVWLATFHRMTPPASPDGRDSVAAVLERFNAALRDEAGQHANIRVIDSDEVLRAVGQAAAFDTRFYYRNKAPYTGAYMNELARRIAASARGFGAHFHKVLALDCDNTLWGGVIGEDLLNGIKLGPHDYPGNIYWRVQQEIAALERSGILLCLCTKNNPADVEEVLRDHPDMVLRERHIVARKVNWEDKASNLRALARELNVGLDSIVFLDDSSFECEAVRQQLPMVKTVQVPATLSEYPRVVAQLKELFLAGGISADSKGKTEQYRQRASAEELKAQFGTQEDYLASLQLTVQLSRNARASAARISELSQKSNQFNLTTRRYSVAEIERMMDDHGGDHGHAVYSLVVGDKFGSAGLTGVATLRYEGEVAHVDNFFMSCRVIGRGVETGIWSRILDDAVARGCTELRAEYIPSAKNAQVADFYDRLGLPLLAETAEGVRRYGIAAAGFAAPANPWIEMTYVE
ncbi:HAD-IIIC family phosphatase [Pseudoduganella namucuonensis]|uniref:HAD-superfamily phosphatase, subfamily IIIC/FkbH-like domain-containing protein n=1 Tax=Pseudoduganella namucuonensis TaxID=1035707 RepID=A0A1I7LV08_9BURK|nr:HAD-IIIC family phosphatase [Pseudoduganella namucuonensis]SFV13521.1 HAD-superfamily phosphatase, subfamily IIIC/FkbH-like domain-containing protein [Pseudoduganella namucuonensis]